MERMDARRLRLYELLNPKLGDEGARELVFQLPAQPEALVTRADLEASKTEVIARMDARFGQVDARFAEVIGEIRAGFSRIEATLTRRMVAIMGAWTILLGSTAAWASVAFG